MGRRRKRGEDEDNGFKQWGGYMAAKVSKLDEQFKQDAVIEKISDIFNGIAIMVNGITKPSSDELKKLMAQHGGLYHMYCLPTTTHIIASNLPNVKIRNLGTRPVVKPAWIVESVAMGRLIDFRRFLLYTNQSVTQPRLEFPVKSATKTASDPNFLEEFYNNSRLHLISTLGAEFKQLVCRLRDNHDGVFPGRNKLNVKVAPPLMSNVVMHIDMDCFFVSVGLRSHPELRGKPVAITHARSGRIASDRSESREKEFALYNEKVHEGDGRVDKLDGHSSMSEIASCSYEARKLGVKNGMFLGQAIKLCPDLKTLPYDFEGYKEVSHRLYETIASYTLDIEAVSCDEMYVDCGAVLNSCGMGVLEWASHIRSEIMEVTGCPCSTGFGENRLQARLATRKAKPNGQYYLEPDNVETYMSDIPLADLPGVGRATLSKLATLGLRTCGDVQVASLKVLQRELGSKVGETLYDQAKGVDKKPLNFYHERKSVSAEINYGIRFKTIEEAHSFLESLSNEVYNRLNETGMRARCLTLKLLVRAENAPVETAKFLGHGVCDSITKNNNSNTILNNATTIYREAKTIYDKINPKFADLRGMGIQLTKLEKNNPSNKVLKEFFSNKPKTTTKKTVDLKILNELPKDIERELIHDYQINETVLPTEDNPFNKLNWNDIQPIIKAWIQSEPTPQRYDVDMLGQHFRHLAVNRKIDTLLPIFNFLHRVFATLTCDWHQAYCSILSITQEGMVARYGKTLAAKTTFECCEYKKLEC